MAKYKLYAGLGGGFGGANYQGTYEYETQEDAERDAYNLAYETYERFNGMHGLMSWEEALSEAESYFSEDDYDDYSNELEQTAEGIFSEEVDRWASYYVEKVEDDIPSI